MTKRTLIGFAMLAAFLAGPAAARIETISVHGAALEGNLEGNSADREVIIVLPEDYDANSDRRYPVLYFLHGYAATAKRYIDYVDPEEALTALKTDNPFIVVFPDSHTKRGGSMYASSPTVGDFETFVARDLVQAIDAKYRTIANRDSRGLAGHSMGGYGTFRIGMKHGDVFSSIYAMSACCLSARRADPTNDAKYEVMDPDPLGPERFADYAYFATMAAFAPNPENPPYFIDYLTTDGQTSPMIEARMAANAPAVFLSQYLPALKGMEAIAMDVGDKDFLLEDNQLMHAQLEKFGIDHSYTLYEGDHGNRVKTRFRTHLLPFFAKHLDPEGE